MSTTTERLRPETEQDEPRFGFASAGTLMTPEEFDRTPSTDWEDGYRYELLGGVLVVSPFASLGERDPNEQLGHWLWAYRSGDPRGACLDGTLYEQTIRVGKNRRRADRALWIGLGRRPNPIEDVPTIVVEFVSRKKRDRDRDYVEKRSEYLAAGVREYWVIDRFRRILTVFRPGLDGLVVTAEGTYQTDLLPGFELPVGRLLAVADRWAGDLDEQG